MTGNRDSESRVVAGKIRSYGFCAIGIGGKIALKDIGEEKKFDYEEENEEFDENQSPKGASDSHLSESVAIHVIYIFQFNSYLD